MTQFARLIAIIICIMSLVPGSAAAQKTGELVSEIDLLKSRVRQLEDYITQFGTRIQGMETSLQGSFNQFQESVQSGLENYSQDLQRNITDQIRTHDDTTVILDIVSKTYKKIDTNSGYFLVAIRKTEPIGGGYRLTVNVGNPNFANYTGIKMSLRWGRRYEPNPNLTYDQWRQTMASAQYSYGAKLNAGTWVEFTIDVPAESTAYLGHIECQMDVDSIELNIRREP